MSLNEKLFIIIPLLSMLSNLFLFLTFLAAKKNRLIYSFMILLFFLTAWTAGSLFMRLNLYPGMNFWYEISITGIFCVPFAIYNFIYEYTGQKGNFLKLLLFTISLIMVVLNQFHLFIDHPQVIYKGSEKIFDFHVRWTIIFPILVAVIVLGLAGRMAYRSVKYGGMAANQFTPFIIGISIMFAGTIVEAVPGLGTLPNDTFVCMINAFCLYYALYKRRVISLTHVTSRSPTYLVAAIITTTILIFSYRGIDEFYTANFTDYLQYKTIAFTVAFSLFTMIIYQLFVKLTNNLFIRPYVARENELKKFSNAVNHTLDIGEIVEIFMEFVTDNIQHSVVHISTFDKATGEYHIIGSSDGVTSADILITKDHPIAMMFANKNVGTSMADFKRTTTYKSMWESEKRQLEDLHIDYLLPIVCDKELTGLAFISTGVRNKPFALNEISFLESVAAILSISVKNAIMYEKMRNEARIDALTGLYNRKYFMESAEKELKNIEEKSHVLTLLDLDDFHLYNELYGSQDGDVMLKSFADIIVSVIGTKGIVGRYSGKEFTIFLPGCDIPTAYQYIERVKNMLSSMLSRDKEKTKKFLTFSAGICAYPISASTLQELMTNVSLAVFAAKHSGKNKIVVYRNSQTAQESAEFSNGMETMRKKDIGQSYAATIFALTAAINAKDQYTFAHSNNVSEYSAILAEHLGLDSEHVEIIRQAGLLHDIGKIGIPESILSKNGHLTPDEYEIMKGHVENSIDIIRHLPSLDYVIPVAIGHHEHWDGKGYPRGLAGEEIPIGARCLCVADSFDAMVSRRSYKEPMPVDDALREIERGLGRQFDPKIGRLFVDLVKSGDIKVKLTDVAVFAQG